MKNNNVPIIGRRKVKLGLPGEEVEIQLPSELNVNHLIVQAQQAAQQALIQQGHIDLAGKVTPFQLEPAAFAVFVGAADAIEKLREEVQELREEIAQLKEPPAA